MPRVKKALKFRGGMFAPSRASNIGFRYILRPGVKTCILSSILITGLVALYIKQLGYTFFSFSSEIA